MRLVKEINKKKTYEASNGKSYWSSNYVLEFENGSKIYIKPAFQSDFSKLSLLAEHRDIEDEAQ